MLEGRKGGFSSQVSRRTARESRQEAGSLQPGVRRAGPGAAVGRAGAGRAGAGRAGAAGLGASGAPGKCLDRLKSEIVPSLDAEALPPAPE